MQGRIEAQCGIALLENAGAGEQAVAGVEWIFAAMLGDDDGSGSEKRGAWAAEQAEGERVLLRKGVGGIEKENAEPRRWILTSKTAQKGCDAPFLHAHMASRYAESVEVLAKDGQGGGVLLDEGHGGGAAAEGLNADRSGAGIEIEKDGLSDVIDCALGEHVEEGLAQPVGGGPGVEAGWGEQGPRPEFSCNHTHCFLKGRPGCAGPYRVTWPDAVQSLQSMVCVAGQFR